MSWLLSVWGLGALVTVSTATPVFLQMRHHPRGLHILFFAEMWERFSYYGMRALLILYLTQHFLFQDGLASAQYGAYTSLVYLMPLVGGLVADRYLGTRKATAFGALLLVAGHLAMAIEGEPARDTLIYEGQRYELIASGRGDQRDVAVLVGETTYRLAAGEGGQVSFEGLAPGGALPPQIAPDDFTVETTPVAPIYEAIFFLALSFIVMGVGFLKANISTMVGQLYPDGDPRRDAGFTLYYFGINLGGFWAALLCGYLGVTVGWWAGFGLAGVGMALGWIVFVRGRFLFFLPGPNQLPDTLGRPPEPAVLAEKVAGPISRENLIYLLGLLGVPLTWLLFRVDGMARRAIQTSLEAVPDGASVPTLLSVADFFSVVGAGLLIASVAVIGYLAVFMARHCTRIETERMVLVLILIAASVVFWTLFEQAGSSLNQFAERNTDLTVGGFTVTSAQTQSFNGFFILIFAPIFAALWTWLGQIGRDPSPAVKFALALVQVGAGFLLLVWGANFADDQFRVPVIFLAGAYMLHTGGEMFLSPIGLSMVTRLSVTRVVATMMAVWFLSLAWAQWLGALVARMTASETVGGRVLDPSASLATYVGVFKTIGVWAIGIGLALGLASVFLNRLAHEDKAAGAAGRDGAKVAGGPPDAA